ncbi:GapS4a family protein [Leucothrix mucor]|uniref:GapS4a family protein n=1 Tax=Leucothrix mucor TaxID=45248 RepID=UPI0003B4A897|nr:hypothetical protein [Leucothrix mucor]
MSGEGSKSSGEIGEKIASKLLDKIGWKLSMHNVSIRCNTSTHLNESNNQKKSHGEDQIFVYDDPFHDEVTEFVHVSVKNTKNPYPATQDAIKKKVKEDMDELHEIIECARYSEELSIIEDQVNPKKYKKHSGLLVFLSNHIDELETSLRPSLANMRLNNSSSTPIYLIDNARASFLLQVIDHLDKECSTTGKYEFYYPNLGTAVSVDTEPKGSYLPLGMIASDLVVAIVQKDKTKEMFLYSNDPFSDDSYKKLIGYGLSFSRGLIDTIKIGISNFNPTKDMEDATRIRLAFQDRNESVTPFSLRRSILDLVQE